MDWAIVKNGVVVNLIVADQEFVDSWLPNSGYDSAVQIVEETLEAQEERLKREQSLPEEEFVEKLPLDPRQSGRKILEGEEPPMRTIGPQKYRLSIGCAIDPEEEGKK